MSNAIKFIKNVLGALGNGQNVYSAFFHYFHVEKNDSQKEQRQ